MRRLHLCCLLVPPDCSCVARGRLPSTLPIVYHGLSSICQDSKGCFPGKTSRRQQRRSFTCGFPHVKRLRYHPERLQPTYYKIMGCGRVGSVGKQQAGRLTSVPYGLEGDHVAAATVRRIFTEFLGLYAHVTLSEIAAGLNTERLFEKDRRRLIMSRFRHLSAAIWPIRQWDCWQNSTPDPAMMTFQTVSKIQGYFVPVSGL